MAGMSALSNVLPTLITGVVGVAGIGGAVFAARMTSKSQHEDLLTSISAGREDARKANKRRTYADALAAIIGAFRAHSECREDAASDDAEIGQRAWAQINEAVYQMFRACYEARLIAPAEIRDGLDSAMGILGIDDYSAPEGWREELFEGYDTAIRNLFSAMRADLDNDETPKRLS